MISRARNKILPLILLLRWGAYGSYRDILAVISLTDRAPTAVIYDFERTLRSTHNISFQFIE
jgi:hypothetical protein